MKYEIIGEPMPVVVCDLEANEAMITERGSMVWICLLYTSPSPRDTR